jgi:hypothetical protein
VCLKYWETIAENLSKAGWSLGWISAVDSNGRTIWIADAHRDDGKHFVVHADEKLTAFVELELAIHAGGDFQRVSAQTSSNFATTAFPSCAPQARGKFCCEIWPNEYQVRAP